MTDAPTTGLTDSWRSAGAPSLSFTFSFFSFFPLFFLLVEGTSSSPLETYEPERRCVSKCAHVLSLRVEWCWTNPLFLFLSSSVSLSLFRFPLRHNCRNEGTRGNEDARENDESSNYTTQATTIYPSHPDLSPCEVVDIKERFRIRSRFRTLLKLNRRLTRLMPGDSAAIFTVLREINSVALREWRMGISRIYAEFIQSRAYRWRIRILAIKTRGSSITIEHSRSERASRVSHCGIYARILHRRKIFTRINRASRIEVDRTGRGARSVIEVASAISHSRGLMIEQHCGQNTANAPHSAAK